MDITGLKAKAEADLRAAEAKYETAHSRALAAQADEAAERENLARMKAVFEWVQGQDQPGDLPPGAVRHPTGPDTPANRTRFGRPIPEVAISDLCQQALESIGRSQSTRQLRDHLAADGHDFTVTQVRGALKYLSTKKPPVVLTTKGSGIWRLNKAAKAATTTSVTPTVFSAGVSPAGVNGSASQGAAVPPERG